MGTYDPGSYNAIGRKYAPITKPNIEKRAGGGLLRRNASTSSIAPSLSQPSPTFSKRNVSINGDGASQGMQASVLGNRDSIYMNDSSHLVGPGSYNTLEED